MAPEPPLASRPSSSSSSHQGMKAARGRGGRAPAPPPQMSPPPSRGIKPPGRQQGDGAEVALGGDVAGVPAATTPGHGAADASCPPAAPMAGNTRLVGSHGGVGVQGGLPSPTGEWGCSGEGDKSPVLPAPLCRKGAMGWLVVPPQLGCRMGPPQNLPHPLQPSWGGQAREPPVSPAWAVPARGQGRTGTCPRRRRGWRWAVSGRSSTAWAPR